LALALFFFAAVALAREQHFTQYSAFFGLSAMLRSHLQHFRAAFFASALAFRHGAQTPNRLSFL